MSTTSLVIAFVFYVIYEVSSRSYELSKNRNERIFWASSQTLAMVGMCAYVAMFFLA